MWFQNRTLPESNNHPTKESVTTILHYNNALIQMTVNEYAMTTCLIVHIELYIDLNTS